MEKNKEFYQICGINATNEDFEKNGFRVISFGAVKREIMSILKTRELAYAHHLYNSLCGINEEFEAIDRQLENIVFKESRGGGGRVSIGWENGKRYLDYHSGVIYKWFKTV